jgi:integrase
MEAEMASARGATRRVNLNDRILKALKPAPDGKPYDVRDTVVPGLRVRVMGSGQRSFVLLGRYPGSPNPTRRAMGEYGAISLADARGKAQAWLDLIGKGIDPQDDEDRKRNAELQKRKNTFLAVAEDFIAEKLRTERKGREVERDIKREFIPIWKGLPITEITDLQVLSVIKTKQRAAPAQARNLLGIAKRLFSWAVDQRCYGLTVSPADTLKPTKIIGKKPHGQRVLDDAELFALWRAAERTRYPYGPVYKLLILTALRLNEAADAQWSEFDLENNLWIIPAERMKGRDADARVHAVPLTADILAILENLPRFNRGKFLFSTTFGEKAVWISDKIKNKIEERMLRTLRAMARRRGEDAATIELKPWKNHDIRRSVRSNLSRLRISEEAREAVLAHARPGIKGVYDHHDYLDEKREALEAWAARLRSIVDPPAPNVIDLQARASS